MNIALLPSDCIYEISLYLRHEYNDKYKYNTHKSFYNFILTCKTFLNASYFTMKITKPLCCFMQNHIPCGSLCYRYEKVYNLKNKLVHKKRTYCLDHNDKCNWVKIDGNQCTKAKMR